MTGAVKFCRGSFNEVMAVKSFAAPFSCFSTPIAPMVSLSRDAMMLNPRIITSRDSAPTEPSSPRRSQLDLGCWPHTHCLWLGLTLYGLVPTRPERPWHRGLSSAQRVDSPADHVPSGGTSLAGPKHAALSFDYANLLILQLRRECNPHE